AAVNPLTYGIQSLRDLLEQRERASAVSELAPGAEFLTAVPWRACLASTDGELLQAVFSEHRPGAHAEVCSHVDLHRPTLRGTDDRLLILKTPPTGRSMRADDTLFELVEELVRTRTILFLGFDIDDPDFAQILALLDRVGRGRPHFAWLSHAQPAEADQLRDALGIQVIHGGDDVVRSLFQIQRALWATPAQDSQAEDRGFALDLARVLRGMPLRADLAHDAALTCELSELDLLLEHLSSLDFVEVRALLQLGNVMVAHGRGELARRVYAEVLRRRPGAEFRRLCRFNLALLDYDAGDPLAAVDGLAACAAEDRSCAMVPSQFEIVEVRGRDGTRTLLSCTDAAGEEYEIAVSAFSRPLGTLEQRRFTDEVRRAARLSHPAILPVRGGFTDGRMFGVLHTPRVGFVLSDMLAQGQRMDLDQVPEVFGPLLDGLCALHQHGLVHRNIHPGQILLTEQGACLRGLGFLPVVSPKRPAVRQTCHGYLAPEVLAGEQPGPAADVWALTAVLFRALTGREVGLTNHPASSLRPDLDPRIDQVLAHALHADPALRLSPRRLRTELAAIVSVPLLLVSRMDLAYHRDSKPLAVGVEQSGLPDLMPRA
ncbi:MAG: protein kinase domain-containing protein, partial [Nannocystaceae bacterium]